MDRDGNFYFLEVNTRIQVEHPITEMVTGVDLLKLQINIAQGYKLPYKQSDISQKGHSIECRIYAEDAKNNFMPTGGEVLFLKEPTGNGIRVDTGIIKGSVISPFYDPIMSKIIVHAETRELASLKMIEALKNTVILGVKNSIPFMINVLNSESFISGNTFTNVIGDNLTEWTKDLIDIEDENIGKKEFSKVLAAIALHKTNNKKSIDKSINPNNPNSNVWVEIGDMKFL
jgi:acetyl-CoA carboxylase biotin carboxylase subunit